jgi:hypothetical protein
MYKLIWVFVEGSDDRRFVERVLRPVLERKYDYLDIWEYAREHDEKIVGFLRSINSMNADYLFLADIDNSPCVTAKKEILAHRYGQSIQPARAVVVAREIESWYMAGMDEAACRESGVKELLHTDELTKEQFEALVPAKYSVVDFMNEILSRFRIEVAKCRNRSFGYLMDLLETQIEKV